MNNLKEAFDTLISQGGFTYSLNGETPKRYIIGTGHFFILMCEREEFERKLLSFVFDNTKRLSSAGWFLGAWMDDDKIYFDVSFSNDSLEEAVELGSLHHQNAIYDIEAKASLRIRTLPERLETRGFIKVGENLNETKADEIIEHLKLFSDKEAVKLFTHWHQLPSTVDETGWIEKHSEQRFDLYTKPIKQ